MKGKEIIEKKNVLIVVCMAKLVFTCVYCIYSRRPSVDNDFDNYKNLLEKIQTAVRSCYHETLLYYIGYSPQRFNMLQYAKCNVRQLINKFVHKNNNAAFQCIFLCNIFFILWILFVSLDFAIHFAILHLVYRHIDGSMDI